jgi:hypothetical protein
LQEQVGDLELDIQALEGVVGMLQQSTTHRLLAMMSRWRSSWTHRRFRTFPDSTRGACCSIPTCRGELSIVCT